MRIDARARVALAYPLFGGAVSVVLRFDSRMNAGDPISVSGVDGATDLGIGSVRASVNEIAVATER